MNKQQERSGKPVHEALDYLQLPEHISCEFTGYDELVTATKVVAIIDEHIQQVNSIKAGSSCWIVTEKSPLFAMGGGQSPDRGSIIIDNDQIDTQEVRLISGMVAALVHTPKTVKVGDMVTVRVDEEHRKAIMQNHTATHLLQAALMELFDKNIKQSGSFVSADYLRFDFTSNSNISHELLNRIEQLVNKKIQDNKNLEIEYVTFDQAKKIGALAFFEEKYVPERVRVVAIPEFSAELCCGTHVHATGDIGAFKITELKAISAGNRRIVATTGKAAIALFENLFDGLKELSNECKVPSENLLETIRSYKKQIKDLGASIKGLKKEIRKTQVPQWISQVELIRDIPFLFIHLDNYTNEELKEIGSDLINKKPGFYFLISSIDDRTFFVAQVASTLADKANLKKFGLWLKERHGINGGGSSTLIHGGGGKFDAKLNDSIKEWLKTE